MEVVKDDIKEECVELNFYQAFAAASAEIPMFEKKNKVSFKQTKYAYIKLEEINAVVKPILAKYGLFLTHKVENGFLTTSLVHVASKDGMVSHFKIHGTDPQKIGAEITYGKRYNTTSILNIDCAGEDDDCVSLYNNRNDAPPTRDECVKKVEGWLANQTQDRVANFWDYISVTFEAKNFEGLSDEQLIQVASKIK